MSNWSKGGLYKRHHSFDRKRKILFKSAGTNDKKWSDEPMFCSNISCDNAKCEECRVAYFEKYNTAKSASTKPEYTPEQQEMLDWLSSNIDFNCNKAMETKDFYPAVSLAFDYRKDLCKEMLDKYIGLINKHRR